MNLAKKTAMNPAKKPGMKPKQLTVQKIEALSPYMQRIIFSGEDVAKFLLDSVGGYLKFLFNEQGGTELIMKEGQQRPTMRTYTIRALDHQANALTVDFVRHGDGCSSEESGVAGCWAMNAKPGDVIFAGGPGLLQPFNVDSEWLLFVADMTSLPAAAVQLAKLPDDARGVAMIEVTTEADIQSLDAPEGIDIQWHVEAQSEGTLSDSVKALPLAEHDSVSVWCACEFNQMRSVRRYVSDQLSPAREKTYFSSYWKRGVTEDGHKLAKREDAEALKNQMS